MWFEKGQNNPEVIHIYHKGEVLCAFTSEPPDRWPPGHDWVSVRHTSLATCEACKQKMLASVKKG